MCELLSNNSLFVYQFYEDKSLALQTVNYYTARADLFYKKKICFIISYLNIILGTQAKVDYKGQNKLMFYHFLNCHQAVNIYRSS